MTDDNRPNYFLLLGIDPDDPWLGAALKTLLGTKRGEWSRTVLNGMKTSKAVLTAQAALDRFDNILLVMTDPILREKERAAARVRLADIREQRRAAVERDLRIMQSKGFLWDAEVQALRRNYPELADDRELLERIDRLPKHPVAEQHVVPDQLEPVTANGIGSRLAFIGERSLYTLLGTVDPRVDEHAPREALYRAAQTLYQEIQQDMNRQDPRLNAKLELAGYAMQVFETAEQRHRYDNTLAVAPVVELIAKYQSALASIRRFESNQVERFLTEASAAGVDKDVALAMLLKHFDLLKWTVLLPAGVSDQAAHGQVRCEACQSWNDKESQFCVVCGTRLQITCPSCGRSASGHGKCGNCGFPVGDYDWVSLLLRQCEEALNQQDFAAAEEKYKAAAEVWTSAGDDELAVRLRQASGLLAGLRERRAAEDQNTARQLGVLTEQRNYHAALNKATNAPASVPDRERVIREATEHIREADRLCDLAKRTGTSPRLQVKHYTAALAQCADHRRATIALSALPPDPARDLRVKSVEGVVRLAWEPSETDNVRYVIVRKTGMVAPASVADGSRIATVHRTSYDDRAPEPGVPLHYAVYAQRNTGTASEQGAVTTEPVFLTEEVTVTAQRTDDGVVELEWQLPIHANGVRIRRSAADTTTEVPMSDPIRLRDEGLTNGVSHTYTLRAGYPGPHLSAGISVVLIPGRPPAAPGPVHVHTVSRNLGVCYRLVNLLPQGAEPGTASVLWAQQRPPIRPGQQYPVTELAGYGSLLTETAAQSFALPRPGLYYFAQVVIQRGIGYFGDIRRYAARDEVGDLAAQNLGTTIRLTWAWPEGVTEAMVGYNHDDAPADPALAAHREVVKRVGNDRTGWYDATGSTPRSEQKFFFVVASAEHRDNELFVSTGERCTARLSPTAPKRPRKRWRS